MALNVMRMIHLALVLACAAPIHANAQWKWRDAQGGIHYSDQPPPAQIPARDILRAGNGSPLSAPMPTTEAGHRLPPPSASTHSKPLAPKRDALDASVLPAVRVTGQSAPTSSDRNDWRALDEQIRQRDALRLKEKAEQEQKSRQAGELERACDTLRAELRTLESGIRIASVAEDGERQVLDEVGRTQRIDRLRRDLESHCKPP